MKSRLIVFVLGCFGAGFLFGHFLNHDQKEVFVVKENTEELIEIYKQISSSNVTQRNILDNYGRLMHYVAGHDFRHFVIGCPECGLVDELNLRKQEIDKEIESIESFLVEHPEKTLEYKDKLTELTLESNLVTRYIFNSQNRAKEVGKLMMNNFKEREKENE